MQVNEIKSTVNFVDFYTNEKDLYQLWIQFCKHSLYLKEFKLKGIDSGTLNEFEGPDFQGAEFELAGKIYRGDVEIHKCCSDWSRHGHHLDHRYDKVVLHLVYGNLLQPVFNSKNQIIPSVSMLQFPIPVISDDCYKNCAVTSKQQYFPVSIFQTLALQRMVNKANEICNLIASNGIDQTLYLLMLKSLGNVVNKNNYERLSQIIPWKLVHFLKKSNNSLQFWIALYYGAAGFINKKSDPSIFKYWKICHPLIEGICIEKENWRFGGIRPKNYPQYRLEGLAMFIYQMEKPSVYNILEQLFYKRYATSEFIAKLNSIFSYDKSKYQNIHNLNQSHLWGRSLIIEFTGNVFIPLFYKIALMNSSFGFAMYLKQLYLELPATQHYGILNSFNDWFKTHKKETKYFYINQALIHLKNTYCSFNNFQECPLKTNQQKN